MQTKSENICIIDSDLKNLPKVENFLRHFFLINSIPQEIFNKVYLCLSEAVCNSIFHGNNNDLQKSVRITLKIKRKRLLISVKDEGNGFKFNKLIDPTNSENIRNEFGRGIFIIKALTESVCYRKNYCFLKFSF